MLTRRKFMQVHGASLALLNRAARAGSRPPGEAESPPAINRAAERDYWNDWPDYLAEKVHEAQIRRQAELCSIRTQAALRSRQSSDRDRVWKLIGGPLDRTPLHARTVNRLQRYGYKIENVIFESQPEVFVTANLYTPTRGQPPFCGILSPPGHYWEGKSARDYQCLYQNLARKGYVVLAFDLFGEGERHQYLDPKTGRSRYSDPTEEHNQAGRPLILLGASFAQYCVWDAVRATDYLVSRPEVDPEKIGCVGHSGGATLTMYLCALEPRIQVAVAVEGHFRNFAARHYDAPGSIDDAEQNLAGSLMVEIDRADLLRAFAPKPLLMTYTSQDAGVSPYYLEAVDEAFGEVSSAYAILGAGNRLRLFRAFLPHRYDFFNRRETYAWLNHWLAKTDDIGVDEAGFDALPPDALRCTRTGQVLTSLGGSSVVRLNADRARKVVPLPLGGSANFQEAQQRSARTRTQLRRLLSLPVSSLPLSPRTLSSGNLRELTIEEFEFESEQHVRVPGWFLKPRANPRPLPTVLYLSESGKDAVVDGPNEMEALVQKGFALCAIDQRGFGVTSPRYPSTEPLRYYDGGEHLREDFAWASLVLGKPPLGQRVWDFIRCLDYLETRPDVDRSRIHVFGARGGAVTALMGYALDRRPSSILCDEMLSDFTSVAESEDYTWGLTWFVFGILRHFDLPDIIGASAPRPCWLLNVVGPTNEVLSRTDSVMRFSPAIESYSRLSASSRLRLLVEPKEKRMEVVANWLQNT